MKKLESSLMNMVLVLTGVTVIAGALLGYVNELTKGPIAEANAKALSDAIALVVPGFDNNPAEAPESIELNGATYKIYKATKGGEFIGAAVESSANGFGGALNVLVGFDKEGYIIDYTIDTAEKKTLTLVLKYVGTERTITNLKRISKPGLRIYASADNLPKVLNGLGIAIISTSKGMMTDKQARAERVGGEVLAYVW